MSGLIFAALALIFIGAAFGPDPKLKETNRKAYNEQMDFFATAIPVGLVLILVCIGYSLFTIWAK